MNWLHQQLQIFTAVRAMGRGILVGGRGAEFGMEIDPSQAYSMGYGIPGYAPGMMQAYQLGYQAPYGYQNMFMGAYPYGFQQFHPGYQVNQGAAFDPRQQAMQFQMGQANRSMPSPGQR